MDIRCNTSLLIYWAGQTVGWGGWPIELALEFLCRVWYVFNGSTTYDVVWVTDLTVKYTTTGVSCNLQSSRGCPSQYITLSVATYSPRPLGGSVP